MPANDPNAYKIKGVPSSGLRKPTKLKKPKKVKIPKIKSKKKIGRAKTTTELQHRLKRRRGTGQNQK